MINRILPFFILSLSLLPAAYSETKSFSPEQALVIIITATGEGTGFVASIGGTNYIITNTHVLSATPNFECYTVNGKLLATGKIEFEANNDLARIQVLDFDGTPFNIRSTPNPRISEPIKVYGNSKGANVITEISGNVLGSGPAEIEVSAEFVEGNSGSPIVDKDGLVLGVDTYISEDAPTRISANTRFAKARRMGIRLTEFTSSWIPVSLSAFNRQSSMLYDINTLINHFLEVQQMMFTEKEKRIEKLTSKTYLKIRETRWTEIGYTDNPQGIYFTPTWYSLLKGLCDAHDSLTAVRYEGKVSTRSHQMRMLFSQLNKSLQDLQQMPRKAIQSTAWVTPFYKACGDDLLARMPEVDQKAAQVYEHFNYGWK